jgi:hypothetical protein
MPGILRDRSNFARNSENEGSVAYYRVLSRCGSACLFLFLSFVQATGKEKQFCRRAREGLERVDVGNKAVVHNVHVGYIR